MNETSASKKESKDVIEAPAVDPFAAMVERIAANPDIDADKMQKILDMQIQVMDRTARDEFYGALNQVQANMPPIVNDAWNDQTKSGYAKITAVHKAIKPVYTAHGFATTFTQDDSPLENHIRIRGTLMHRAGHREDGYFVDVPLDKTGLAGKVNKTDVHAAGSSFQYGRRYCTCLMFDVASGEDLDGNQPDAELSDVQREAIGVALKTLHPDDQQSFWRKARADEGDYDVLRVHRWDSYAGWFTGKGVELADFLPEDK